MAKLTKKEIEAMQQVKDGADVYNYGLAGLLRSVQRKDPSLIDIGKPREYRGNGADRVPYFGAILTKAGQSAIKAEAR